MAASNRDAGLGPDRESTIGTPRWVRVFGIIFLVVVLLFVILVFTRGPGGRGPHALQEHEEHESGITDGGGNDPSTWRHL